MRVDLVTWVRLWLFDESWSLLDTCIFFPVSPMSYLIVGISFSSPNQNAYIERYCEPYPDPYTGPYPQGFGDTCVWSPYGNEAMGYDKFICVEPVQVGYGVFTDADVVRAGWCLCVGVRG